MDTKHPRTESTDTIFRRKISHKICIYAEDMLLSNGNEFIYGVVAEQSFTTLFKLNFQALLENERKEWKTRCGMNQDPSKLFSSVEIIKNFQIPCIPEMPTNQHS